jgi:hypothetical protein
MPLSLFRYAVFAFNSQIQLMNLTTAFAAATTADIAANISDASFTFFINNPLP